MLPVLLLNLLLCQLIASCVFSHKTLRLLNWSCDLGETFAWGNKGEAQPADMPALTPASTSAEVVYRVRDFMWFSQVPVFDIYLQRF